MTDKDKLAGLQPASSSSASTVMTPGTAKPTVALPGSANRPTGAPPPLVGADQSAKTPATWQDFATIVAQIGEVLDKKGPEAAQRLQTWIKEELEQG